MAMDKIKFDYLRSKLHPKIYWEVAKDFGPVDENTVEYRKNIRDVALRLAKRNADWMLVIKNNYNAQTSKRFCGGVEVYESEEYLGDFWYGYNYSRSCPAVNIDCRELSRKRVRGRATKTTDNNKAIKIIEANFKRLSRKEITETKLYAAKNNIYSAMTDKSQSFQAYVKDITPAVMKVFDEHYEEIKHLIPEVSSETFAAYSTAREDYLEVYGMYRIADKKAPGLVLTIVGNEYLAVNRLDAQGEPVVFTSDTLPTGYRAKLGMLKLIEPGNLITGVGARTSDDTYILTNDDNTNT